MSNNISCDQLRYIVNKILDNASDISESRSEKRTEFYDGMMQAYYEVLDIMKNQLIIDDADLEEFGLDINLEKVMV